MFSGLDPDDAPDVGRAREIDHPHSRVCDKGSNDVTGIGQVGASSLGFITTVLPTASGMAMDRMPSTSGAFHGDSAPTTP
jgi:hypothetical protein